MVMLCNRAMHIANRRKLRCSDFGISSGLRTKDEQYAIWLEGRTYEQGTDTWHVTGNVRTHADGTNKLSVHQSGNAIDFFALNNGKADYRPGPMALVATCFLEAAMDLGIQVNWGGNFNSLSDAGHIEIIGE